MKYPGHKPCHIAKNSSVTKCEKAFDFNHFSLVKTYLIQTQKPLLTKMGTFDDLLICPLT